MLFKQLWVLSCTVASAIAAPAGSHVVHEKRHLTSHNWEKRTRLQGRVVLPVRIALTQSNLDRGHDALMSISDPDSPEYGKHWTPQTITDFFAPSRESAEKVSEWVSSAGIRADKLRLSTNLGWIEFDTTAEDLEKLLKTEYYVYSHKINEKAHIGCLDYSIPEHLREHVDFITPTIHFDAQPEGPAYSEHMARAELRADQYKAKRNLMWGGPKPGPRIPTDSPAISQSSGTSNCDFSITPPCLRALYKIPLGTLNNTSFGIVEYSPETFLQEDLDMFWNTKGLDDAFVPAGTTPTFDGVDGGYLAPLSTASFGINGEPDLDLEYAIDLVYPQQVTLFQVGDNGEYAANISFNNFLDAIDGSYCTFRGGDSKKIDEPFPDPGGYMHKQNCGIYKAPAVISTSYGYNEHDLSKFYERRQCYEYMKLGLAGTSFIYSSGDYGVAGNQGFCIDPQTGQYNNGSSGRFNPSFPGVCPYVTSVGATQVNQGSTVNNPESACEQVIYSGGGFSDNFAIPSYQATAVKNYFARFLPPYTSTQYNNSMASRGYPDVAANGANYIITLDGHYQYVFGTSASAPVFASVVTLINAERAQKGKSSLGFLNTALYKNPTMFNDIVSGSNPGCGTAGFTAEVGWDPVTGLGTPNYEKMLAVLG